ncbi:unnamed protein product [marine sediment metagenome]|uniref:Uncharacterized protein n=1 Tax=marine sediment metagenome TaxID=412755 RepID=X1IXG4_9ZZZZ
MVTKSKEQKGRKGDKMLAHLTPGEIVIPRPFAEDDDFRAVLAELFRENNADLEEFIVGSGKNKINPETGYMEFGFWGEIFKPFKAIGKWVGGLFKGPKIDIPKPPPLPPPVATPTEISAQAMKVGETERRRLRGRRGRASTVLTPGFLAPARTTWPGLKQTLG